MGLKIAKDEVEGNPTAPIPRYPTSIALLKTKIATLQHS